MTNDQPAPLVTLNHVTVSYGDFCALRNISWSLPANTHWVISGPNGAGKSTLLQIIRGEKRADQRLIHVPETTNSTHTPYPPNTTDTTGTTTGTTNTPDIPDATGTQATAQATAPHRHVIWNLDGTPETTPLAIRKRIAVVTAEMQEKYLRQQWKLTGEECLLSGIDDGPMLYRQSTDEERTAAQSLARQMGIEALLDMELPAMSQGQLRRTLMARALMGNPAILVLDEVCEGLDTDARAAVLNAADRAAETGVTLLFVSHRQNELPASITHRLYMEQGQIISSGLLAETFATDSIADNITDNVAGNTDGDTPSLAQSVQTGSVQQARQNKTESRVSPDKQQQAGQEQLVAQAFPAHDIPVSDQAPPYTPQPLSAGTPIFLMKDADVFIERVPVLKAVSWTFAQGENWSISGPNGAGKSTLMRLLSADERQAWGGTVEWFGEHTPNLLQLHSRQGMVSDKLQATYGHDKYHSTLLEITAEELVWSGFTQSVGLWEWRNISAEQKATATRWIDWFGLSEHTQKSMRNLSYGLLRRFLLCRAVAHSPNLLLLDEACSGLDAVSRRHFLSTLRSLARAGMHMVYVTHRQEEVIPEITHELKLADGTVQYAGLRKPSSASQMD